MAIAHDLTIPVGDTWRSPRWALVIGDTVVDVSDGWTVKAQARAYPQATAVLATWTNDAGVEFGTGEFTVGDTQVEGTTFRLHLTQEQTEAMDVWAGVWDLEVSHPAFDDGAPYRKTLVYGRIRTTADVTR